MSCNWSVWSWWLFRRWDGWFDDWCESAKIRLAWKGLDVWVIIAIGHFSCIRGKAFVCTLYLVHCSGNHGDGWYNRQSRWSVSLVAKWRWLLYCTMEKYNGDGWWRWCLWVLVAISAIGHTGCTNKLCEPKKSVNIDYFVWIITVLWWFPCEWRL